MPNFNFPLALLKCPKSFFVRMPLQLTCRALPSACRVCFRIASLPQCVSLPLVPFCLKVLNPLAVVSHSMRLFAISSVICPPSLPICFHPMELPIAPSLVQVYKNMSSASKRSLVIHVNKLLRYERIIQKGRFKIRLSRLAEANKK